jgi:preprotein translocase subunit SecG
VQRKKSPRACNNNKRWFSEPLQALTLRLFLRRRVLAWIRTCNDRRLLSEALQILTLMLSLLFLLEWDKGSGHEKTDAITQDVQQQSFLLCFVILLHQEVQEVTAILSASRSQLFAPLCMQQLLVQQWKNL